MSVYDNSFQGIPSSKGELFANNIDTIDCAVFDPNYGILGFTWKISVSLIGDLDRNHFVYDFSHLKKIVRQLTKETFDHRLIVCLASKDVEHQKIASGERWILTTSQKNGSEKNSVWEYECPTGAVYPIDSTAIEKKRLTKEFEAMLRQRLPKTISKIKVHLEDVNVSDGSFYRYTHGIQGHEGMCQRLFHGHTGKIEIFEAAKQRIDLQEHIVNSVLSPNIHITCPEQIVSGKFKIGERMSSSHPIELAYESSEGAYFARLPAHRVFVVENETSVESITSQLARNLREAIALSSNLTIRCFEGCDKGSSVMISPTQ